MKAVQAERLTGLLAWAIAGDALPATDDQFEQAAQLELAGACEVLLLERKLLELSDRLGSAGIPHLALKGSAFAHTVYPDPSWRSFGDVDVLVPGPRFDDAVAMVTLWGGRRRYREPRPGFVGRFGKGAALAMPDGTEIDLHRTFVAGPFGFRIDLDGLFATAAPLLIADRTLSRLAAEEAFLHACYHAALGSRVPRLVPQRDIAQMLLGAELDLKRVHRLARAWSASAVVALAVGEAWRTLDLAAEHPLARWASGYVATSAERRCLNLYVGERRSYASQMAAAVSAVPGWSGKAAYLRALILPDRAYLEDREGTYKARLRHGVGLVRRLDQDQDQDHAELAAGSGHAARRRR